MLRCHAFPVEDAGDWMWEYPRGSAVGLVTTATAEVGGGKVARSGPDNVDLAFRRVEVSGRDCSGSGGSTVRDRWWKLGSFNVGSNALFCRKAVALESAGIAPYDSLRPVCYLTRSSHPYLKIS
ncbi:predicted protein [Arabidopsis lyrata subsp. lyrata]|uniref:Predicted protein n=1 Tax=Arabidopsis lyrata subsp. lyrata TaxID=81972 RepID=D7L3L8_ARALL|nr:predicted protein [Arabidopsis lyrata subsp. lyrata]